MHGVTSNDNEDARCMQITDPTSFPNGNFDHLLMTRHPRYMCSIVPQSNCEDVELAIGETATCSALTYLFETDGYGCENTEYNCSAHIIIQVMSDNGIVLHRMDSNCTGAMTFNGFERINLHYITCRQTSLKFKLPLTGEASFNTFIVHVNYCVDLPEKYRSSISITSFNIIFKLHMHVFDFDFNKLHAYEE